MNKTQFWIGMLCGFAAAAVVLLISVFAWPLVYTAPTVAPVSAPSAAPADLAGLANRVEILEKDQAYNLKVFGWQQDQKLLILGWTALFISVVAAFLGLKTYNDLERVIHERVNAVLDEELYQLDPTNLRIWVISRDEEQKLYDPKEKKDQVVNLNVEMAKVIERLQLSGLPNVQEREDLDKKSYRGVTIVPVFNGDMEKQFSAFLERNAGALEKDRAAFVLYTQTYQVSKETLGAYPNLATANMPVTAASMVLTVGRGLKGTREKKEKEGV